MPMRLATAVLCALMSFAAAAPAADAPAPDAPDDDAELESAGAGARRAVRRGPPVVVALASDLCGRAIDVAWVAGDVVDDAGAAAAVVPAGALVARIDLAAEPFLDRSAAAVFGAPLLARALDDCRDRGFLKVLVSSEGLGAAAVRSVAESRGFQFARTRPGDGTDVLEFYVDLYWRPSRKSFTSAC